MSLDKDEFLDRDGHVMELMDFLSKIADDGYKTVGFYEVSNSRDTVTVKTYWTGNSNWLFKTLVEGGKLNGHEINYDKEVDALLGHEQVVESVNDLL